VLASLTPLSALAAPPRALPDAQELVALPGGAWLALAKSGVQLIDADGKVRAQQPMRGESLDARADGRGGIALVIDANTQRVLPMRIDLERFTLTALAPLPEAGQSVNAACLYRAAQGHLQAFVIGRNGIAQQFVMRGDEALPVRRLAVAPDAEHCRVDDEAHRLLVSDDGGVWAHRAEPEGAPTREPVALRRPHGPLVQGGGPIAVLAGRVAVADGGRRAVALMAYRDGAWRPAGRVPLPAGAEAEQLVSWTGSRLAMRADGSRRWTVLAAPAPSAAAARSEPDLPIVLPRVQTDPVAQFGDAADDPAIWVHPGDRTRSLVLATDKKRGVGVYDLGGRERQFLEIGRVNNIDVRQDVQLGGERLDIAAATQRDDLSVVLLRIDAQGAVSELARLPTTMEDIYGICLYRSPRAELEVFVNDKSGRFEHLRVERVDGRVVGTRLREFSVASQPEGCVADDKRGRLFIGEEKRGVWSLSVQAAAAAGGTGAPDLTMILPVGRWLHADVEGLGLYHGAAASYLVVSSQGNHSFVVLDAAAPHRVRGAFRIGMHLDARIDGASETDGLDVSSLDFGGAFGRGLLVVQDGFKVLPEGPQNFKLVAWDDVARALKLD
jgi:3-phytase